VGAKALEAGIWGAFQNVVINMADVVDPAFKDEIMTEARAIETRARIKCRQVLEILDSM
jgi:glutamate formiminotransferase/formiminotetrahydrofolate cyclodeaminase